MVMRTGKSTVSVLVQSAVTVLCAEAFGTQARLRKEPRASRLARKENRFAACSTGEDSPDSRVRRTKSGEAREATKEILFISSERQKNTPLTSIVMRAIRWAVLAQEAKWAESGVEGPERGRDPGLLPIFFRRGEREAEGVAPPGCHAGNCIAAIAKALERTSLARAAS